MQKTDPQFLLLDFVGPVVMPEYNGPAYNGVKFYYIKLTHQRQDQHCP